MILQIKTVGIDIQHDAVRLAVAAFQGGRTKILSLLEKEIPEASEQEMGSVVASAIRDAFRENGLGGSTCAVALPAGNSISRIIEMPLTDRTKIRQTVKYQIEPLIPYPVDQVVTDYIMIRQLHESSHVLAVAVAKDLISRKLQTLRMAGVDPQFLTLDALALADFYMTPFDFSIDKTTALLLANPERSFLGFFNGDKLVGYRNLTGILNDNEEARGEITKELRRAFVSFEPPVGDAPDISILCVGGASASIVWPDLQNTFRDFPVRQVDFNENMLAEVPPEFTGATGGYELAIALAHTGLEASSNPINFRQDEFAAASIISQLRSDIVIGIVVLLAMLVAWFASVRAEIHMESKRMDALNEAMLKTFADSMPGIKSPSMAEQRIRAEQERFKSLRNYSSGYVSPLDVIAEVVEGVPAKAGLALNDLAISDGVLRMTGTVGSFDDIDTLKNRIDGSLLLSDVKIDSAAKAEKSDKVVFRIRAEIGRESPPDRSAVGDPG